jgi:hypothetical protein
LPSSRGVKDFLARTTFGDDFFAVTPLFGHLSSPLKRIGALQKIKTQLFFLSLAISIIGPTLSRTMGTTTYFSIGNNT